MKRLWIMIVVCTAMVACGGQEQPGSSSSSTTSSSNSSTSGSHSSSGNNSDLLSFGSPLGNQPIQEGLGVSVEVLAVNDEQVDEVDLYIDGQFFRTELTTPWDWNPAKGDTLLSSLLPGQHTLAAVARTFSGEEYSRSIEIEIVPASLRVDGLSLIDVGRQQTVANFDPIAIGELVEINLDALNINQFSIIANHEGAVASVIFSLNGSQYRVDNGAPFAITSNAAGSVPLPFDLQPGRYDISAMPYSEINGGGEIGAGKSIMIELLRSQLVWSDAPIRMTSSLAMGAPAQATLEVENSGNIVSSVRVVSAPEWLTVGNAGEVEPGETRTLTLTSPTCLQNAELSGSLTLAREADGFTQNIDVNWSCSDKPAFDLAIERFYFNQVVPANDSLEGSDGSKVRLVKGREGLARAFVVRNNFDNGAVPQVELHYRLVSGAMGVYPLTKPPAIPFEVDEGQLGASYNYLLPESFFQPGTEYYVVVDPNNAIAENSEANNRYPENGYLPLDIVSPPVMDIVFVPLYVSGNREFNLTDQDVEFLMESSMVFLPINEYRYSIRQPANYSGTDWVEALQLINTIRFEENQNKFYHGIVNGFIGDGNTGGIAFVSSKSALSYADPDTIAHEFGHNLSLSHTDCGGPAMPEPNYPYANARTGNWGYDIGRQRLIPPDRADLMSYCYPSWIGSFSFEKMIHYFALGQSPRTFQFFAPTIVDPAVVSGIIDGGTASIEGVMDVVGNFPRVLDVGAYSIVLYDEVGNEIHRAGFVPSVIDHSHKLHFDIPLPRQLLNSDTYRIKIFYEGHVLLSEAWLDKTVSAFSVSIWETLRRVDDNNVSIQWNADGQHTLWVRDADSGQLLGMDTTGELLVYTQAAQLELTYALQSRKIKRTVDVPN